MTRDEAKRVLSLTVVLWPHSVVVPADVDMATAVDVWAGMLAGTAYPDADAALRELAATGDRQSPPVGVIVAKAAERASGLPAWDVVWPLLEAKALECVTPRGYRIPRADEFPDRRVGEFARTHWRSICPLPKREALGTLRAQMRDAWHGVAGREQRDRALEAVGAPRVPHRLDEAAIAALSSGAYPTPEADAR